MQSIAPLGPASDIPPPLELQPQEVAALVDQLDDYHASIGAKWTPPWEPRTAY